MAISMVLLTSRVSLGTLQTIAANVIQMNRSRSFFPNRGRLARGEISTIVLERARSIMLPTPFCGRTAAGMTLVCLSRGLPNATIELTANDRKSEGLGSEWARSVIPAPAQITLLHDRRDMLAGNEGVRLKASHLKVQSPCNSVWFEI